MTEEKPETKKQEKRDVERLLKIFSIIFGIFALVILIVIKTQIEEFSLIWVIGIGVLIIVICVVMYFAFWLHRAWQKVKEGKKEDELPSPITLEQAAELIEKELKNPKYADYVVGWKQHQVYVVGKTKKQQVLLVQLEETPYNDIAFQFFIINLHYPNTLWSYVTQEKYNSGELLRRINAMTTDPSEEPDTKVIEEESPLTGIKRKTTETSRKKKSIKKEEKKGDLE